MKNYHLIICNPNKCNIKYLVYPKKSIEGMLLPIVNDICLNGIMADRTIIFCKTYLDTLEVFKNLVCMLGRHDALVSSKSSRPNRICEKYDGSTCSANQKLIVESFTKPDGVIRVVVATIAFGMGLDSPNVRAIIHWGTPSDISSYVQETGRGGRDNYLSKAILYYGGHTAPNACPILKEYCENTTRCRREILVSEFTESEPIKKPFVLHECCDICERKIM